VRKPPIVAVTATSKLFSGQSKVALNTAYTDALRGAGLVPLIVPPIDEAAVPAILDMVQGLVLTGGEDVDPRYFGEPRHPATGAANDLRDRGELALTREAAARRMPILAICRGVQVLNVALGGTLVQDIPTQVQSGINHDAESTRSTRVHEVTINQGSQLAEIVGADRISTNSFHHQSVDRLADGLTTVARSPDGVVEAVECSARGWWAVGVQWHPEELTGTPEDWDRKLFAAFAKAVKDSSDPS
jgi:putative glutamine amidotransferase